MNKKIISIILFITGVLFIAESAFLLIISNYNSGILFQFLLGIVLAAYGLKFDYMNSLGGALRFVRYAVYFCLIIFFCLSSFIIYSAQSEAVTYREDAVIVLGAAVWGDQPSATLVNRLQKAIEYSQKNPQAIIVVSGGKGPQENIPEADAMERYLIEHGIPPDNIMKEDASRNTYENFKFSKILLDNRFGENYTTVFVTNDFHIYRAGLIANQAGLKAEGIPVRTSWVLIPSSYIRECLALFRFKLLGK